MTIRRMNNSVDKSWVFDQSTPGTLLPVFSNVSIINTLTPATLPAAPQYLRSQAVGTSTPGLYWTPSAPAILGSGSATSGLFFGFPLDTYVSTGVMFRPTPIYKRPEQTLSATFYLRTPTVASTSTNDCPTLIWGIQRIMPNAAIQFAARKVTTSGNTHTTGSPGSLNMLDNNFGSTGGTNTFASVTGNTEYACSIQIGTDSTYTSNILGFANSGSFGYTGGCFFICLQHGTTTTANLTGIRNVRITVG